VKNKNYMSAKPLLQIIEPFKKLFGIVYKHCCCSSAFPQHCTACGTTREQFHPENPFHSCSPLMKISLVALFCRT
jgi:hypothetical protein